MVVKFYNKSHSALIKELLKEKLNELLSILKVLHLFNEKILELENKIT